MEHYQLHIGGQWVDTERQFPVSDKYTGGGLRHDCPGLPGAGGGGGALRPCLLQQGQADPHPALPDPLADEPTGPEETGNSWSIRFAGRWGKPTAEAIGEVNGVANQFETFARRPNGITGK
jgi:hypothetical protein